MSNKDKINFDTDFLDQNAKEKPKSKDPNWVFHDSNNAKSPPFIKKESPAKVWLWGVGIVVAIGLIGAFSDSGTSTNTSNNPSQGVSAANDLMSGSGQTFSCASYAYNRAMDLRPDIVTQSQIHSESLALDARTSSLALEKTRIENTYVDEYDQYSIDTYNESIDSFNLKNNRLKVDIANWNARNATFNAKIDTYNNYLDTNCTPQ